MKARPMASKTTVPATSEPVDYGYDYDALRRDVPQTVLIVSRFLGWIATGIWLGSLVVVEFFFSGVLASVLKFVPLLVRHEDWQGRIVGYASIGLFNQVNMIALVCLLLIVQSSLVEARAWNGRAKMKYLPVVLTAILGGLLVFCINLRLDLQTAGASNFAGILDQYYMFVGMQIGLLVVLSLAFVLMQNLKPSPEEIT